MTDSVRNWHYRACCPCGDHFQAWRGDYFFVEIDLCPTCGTPKPGSFSSEHGWKMRTMRWFDTTILLKPKTWGSGFWEVQVGIGVAKPYSEVRP